MAKCDDCDTPIVWLRKPDGGWMPPTEPLFDFAYNDHYTATVEGIAQPVPQVYKKHECIPWEERQRRQLEREQEKRRLIEEDRERRAEAERVQRELEEAQAAQQAENERLERREREREQRRRDAEEDERQARQARARRRKHEKEADRALAYATRRFSQRLLPHPCRDCKAEAGEPCRSEYHANLDHPPYLWWLITGHGDRYQDAPPDDRSKIQHTPRWGPDYDGPWPPARLDAGRYEMRAWLAQNYMYVFEPEKVWLTEAEEGTLTNWLAEFGEIFEEVSDGPEGVADEDGRLTGGGEAGGGHPGRDAREEEARPDRVDPF